MPAMMMHADVVYAYPTWVLTLAVVGAAMAGATGVDLMAPPDPDRDEAAA